MSTGTLKVGTTYTIADGSTFLIDETEGVFTGHSPETNWPMFDLEGGMDCAVNLQDQCFVEAPVPDPDAVPTHIEPDGTPHKFVPEEGPEDLKDCDTCSFGQGDVKDCPAHEDGGKICLGATTDRPGCVGGNWRKIS